MFDGIYINDYCNFNTFKMDFPSQKDSLDCSSLNLLVGRNGSGKSSLLDALFEIGVNNLKKDISKKIDNATFEYRLLSESKVIAENPKQRNSEYLSDIEKNKHLWDYVIRLYTGHTNRQCDFDELHALSMSTKDTKWAFLTYVASGHWHHLNETDKKLWDKLQDVIFGKNNHINPKVIWVDIENYSDNEELPFSKTIRKPDARKDIGNNITRFFWNLESPITIEILGAEPQNTINPLPGLLTLLYKINPRGIKVLMNGTWTNTGFLYKQGKSEKYLPDSFLSDGEHGFFTRFALMMLLRTEWERHRNQRYLILLDEPETHFNENWKTYFLKLICDVFKGQNHDIFIATHSAMLVTDAKPQEVHRLESRQNGIISYPVPINTFGANIVDIGQVLFQMESDIGERSKEEIQNAIEIGDNEALEKLLKEVGSGEWRWKIRTKLNQLQKHNKEHCHYLQAQATEAINEGI